MIPVVYSVLAITAILEIGLQSAFYYVVCYPTLAWWAVWMVYGPWSPRDGLATLLFLATFNHVLYPESTMPLKALVPLYIAGIFLAAWWSLKEPIPALAAAMAILWWGYWASWTIFALCGTLIGMGAIVLLYVRQTRQSRE